MEEAEDVVIIPIKDRSKEILLGANETNNGTTVINITKPIKESFVCEFCSVTLSSLKKLEKHKEQRHGHVKDKLFYCSECGISKDSPKKFTLINLLELFEPTIRF